MNDNLETTSFLLIISKPSILYLEVIEETRVDLLNAKDDRYPQIISPSKGVASVSLVCFSGRN